MSDLKMSDVFSLPVSTNMDLARIIMDDDGALFSAIPENLNMQCEAINSYDSHVEQIAKLERDVEMLRGALSKVLHNIGLLDEDAFGQGMMANTPSWSIRDERINDIEKALAETEPKL